MSAIDEHETVRRIDSRTLHLYERTASTPHTHPEFGDLCHEVREDFVRRASTPAAATTTERAAVAMMRGSSGLAHGCRPPTLWTLGALVAWGVLWSVIGPAAIFVVIALVVLALFYETQRNKRNQRSARCPACRYDLRNLPDGIAPDHLKISIGPRRCPECGEPWPRVPDPPAPAL